MHRTARSTDPITSPPKQKAPSASPPNFDDLPDSAYIRKSQLVPSPIPWSAATLWRKVKAGEFVAPVKVSEAVTAWKVGDVRRWLAAQAAK